MAFIGAGKMAEAILGGLPPVNWNNTVACDLNEHRMRVFRERFGINVVADSSVVLKDADVASLPPTLMLLASCCHRPQLCFFALLALVGALALRIGWCWCWCPRLQVVLAVKPQNVESVFSSIKGLLASDTVLISIVAGLSMEELQRISGCAAVVRTMPNTPAMIGQGMTVWCSTDAVDKPKEELVRRILTAMGHEILVQNEE